MTLLYFVYILYELNDVAFRVQAVYFLVCDRTRDGALDGKGYSRSHG